jgi:hypothetical protein
LRAEFNQSCHSDVEKSAETFFHSNVLQLWTIELDEAEKEVEGWEADIDRLKKKIDEFQFGKYVNVQDAARSGSENVSDTRDQLAMAVLQSQKDGVKIEDGEDAEDGNVSEGGNAGNGNIDNKGSEVSIDEDYTSDNGDESNELHFGSQFETIN